MKNIFFVFVLVMLVASSVSAAPFSPTLLKLSADDVIQYDFDGSELTVPVTVAGTPSGTFFFVYTKGIADQVIAVQNGYLGWHYVNKLDTCIYFSEKNDLDIGSNTITWDGKDQDGNMVPAGEYTYYLWGYDYSSTRQTAAQYILCNAGSGGQQATIVEYGEDDMPLENPIFHSKYEYEKWVFGNDPQDSTLVETIEVSDLIPGWSMGAVIAFEPGNYSNFFIEVGNRDTSTMGVRKLKWVPNGTAELITEWGDDGITTFPGYFDVDPGVVTDGHYLYSTNNQYHNNEEPVGEFYQLDLEDGSIINQIDLTEWWADPDDMEAGAQLNGGPNGINEKDGLVYLDCHCSCLKQVVDPLAEDEDDFVVWANMNGDYVFDINYLEDSERPWVCNDFNNPTQIWTFDPDANDFAIGCPVGLASTFGLAGPDGTGVGYFAAAGETTCWRFFTYVVDSGSSFDGLYMDNQAAGNDQVIYDNTKFVKGIYYLGHDSIRGTLTAEPVLVDEGAPAGFSVAQNSPNPFNPTTTIGFTLAEPGDVSVVVFNAAGQKVDTIVNDFMGSGHHSVTWDGSGFSAGVYFYSVKSNGLSQTQKMTLLK